MNPTGPAKERTWRVLVLTPFYLPAYRGGGPIRTLAAMTADHGRRYRFAVLTTDHDWGTSEPLEVPTQRWVPVGDARVWYVPRGSSAAWTRAWREARRARPEVLYVNGVFPALTSIVPVLLHRLGVLPGRLLIAPRGEFGTGALDLRARKKAAFLLLARATRLFADATWHASTPLEAGEIDSVFPGARVVVRENEADLPLRARRPGLDALPTGAGSGSGARSGSDSGIETGSAVGTDSGAGPLRLVFLGRLTEKKGLDVLLDALAHVRAPVSLDVYGSGAAGYLTRCERLTACVAHPVVFHGPIPPAKVADVFADHDLFPFPTAHENFGHAVAEALARACPVLLPDTTPWTPLLVAGGGALVSTRHPADWAAALEAHARLPPAGRLAARERAADAYDAWRAARPRWSVFDLL